MRTETLMGALAVAGLVALAAEVAAHGRDGSVMMGPGMMGQEQGGPGATGPGYGMMGPGYGMMGPGYGMMGSGYGMMGPGYGMVGPGCGMMGHHHGMMGPGYGMMGPGYGMSGLGPRWLYGMGRGEGAKDLGTGDVRSWLERSLAWHGNKRLKVGTVSDKDDDTIIADIVTVDDSLVQRLAIDRHSGWMRQVD